MTHAHTPAPRTRALFSVVILSVLCTTAACGDDAAEGAGSERDSEATTDTVEADTGADTAPDDDTRDPADTGPTTDTVEPPDDAGTDATPVDASPDTSAPDVAPVDTSAEDTVADVSTDASVDVATDTGGGADDTVEGDVSVEPEPFGACPSFENGRSRGYISSQNLLEQLVSPVIVEASGIAASRANANVIYTHNDSGGEAEIFAINTTNGHRLATYRLEGADTNDWEDISVGPGPEPGASYIYVGDIGDNGGNRENINVYRVREPEVPTRGTPPTVTLRGVDQLEFRYPDGGNNAETMMVDPQTGDLYVVGKDGSGTSPVYRASPPFVPLERMEMELVTTLEFGDAPLEGGRETTAGDFSPSGHLIAIRTYDAIHIWRRPRGRTVDEAFASEPCDAPQVDEPQGEAICFDATSGGYYTLSEGRGQQLYYFDPR